MYRAHFAFCTTAPVPRDINLTHDTAPALANGDGTPVADIPLLWVSAPQSDPLKIVLYFHGGGFYMGSADTHKRFAANLARASGATVVLPDYRLVPEHAPPAYFYDALAVYDYLTTVRGVPHSHIVVAGESAGGSLTFMLLQALIERQGAEYSLAKLPKAAALVSPYVDQSE